MVISKRDIIQYTGVMMHQYTVSHITEAFNSYVEPIVR